MLSPEREALIRRTRYDLNARELLAEIDRLRDSLEFTTATLTELVNRAGEIGAENERLRAAGEGLVAFFDAGVTMKPSDIPDLAERRDEALANWREVAGELQNSS